MPEKRVRHIVVCKTKEDVEPAKSFVQEQGGIIEKEYTIFPGFDVLLPQDSVSTLSGSPHIQSAELDGEVRTQ